jgi:N-acetyl-gamma-glutamyl-phosphate/LysW-gamma-L-alpha-aminoadipyl-6-phosphate reductase
MIRVSVMGGSGYVGGELLRLLISHPACDLQTVTSQRYAGEPLYRAHPNLRGLTTLRFQEPDIETVAASSDLVFTALPHGKSVNIIPDLLQRGLKVVDMTADFRLKDPSAYKEYYGFEHPHPELLKKSVYGLPELHRADIQGSQLVAVPGCMATSAILGLAPPISDGFIDTSKIVVDVKIGSSGAGVNPTIANHHSERSDGVRPYKVTGHRHIAEVEQELSQLGHHTIKIAFTPHAVNMVRGILATAHTFIPRNLTEKDVWKSYRAHYGEEPFIRMVSDKKGLYGLPNPKVTVGTNFCDIGFEVDSHAQRIVVFTALDNLTKGAAGQAVQCFNIMNSFDERTGLNAPGLHP